MHRREMSRFIVSAMAYIHRIYSVCWHTNKHPRNPARTIRARRGRSCTFRNTFSILISIIRSNVCLLFVRPQIARSHLTVCAHSECVFALRGAAQKGCWIMEYRVEGKRPRTNTRTAWGRQRRRWRLHNVRTTTTACGRRDVLSANSGHIFIQI